MPRKRKSFLINKTLRKLKSIKIRRDVLTVIILALIILPAYFLYAANPKVADSDFNDKYTCVDKDEDVLDRLSSPIIALNSERADLNSINPDIGRKNKELKQTSQGEKLGRLDQKTKGLLQTRKNKLVDLIQKNPESALDFMLNNDEPKEIKQITKNFVQSFLS